MSATFPNLSRQLLSPTTSLPFNNFLSLAINTNIRHVHSQIEESAGSSGIPSKNRIKSPNPMALLVSPPLRKGVSCHQGTNNAYIFIPNEKFAHSDKSSGLYGPLSTSSQPSRNIYDYRSPSQTDMYISSELYSNTKSMFTRNFYKRIEDFLDAESLYMVDPGDYNRPDTRRMRRNMLPSMRLTQENSAGEEGSEMVRSACHSPKLISDSIMSSNLFQRRASHSQAPLKGLAIISEDSPVGRRKPSRLDIKMRSPIMEKDTPVSYRASSRGSMFNTPASVKGFVYFGSNQKMEKTLSEMKDCSSAELKNLNTSLKMMRGAQSVHEKISNGGYFKA